MNADSDTRVTTGWHRTQQRALLNANATLDVVRAGVRWHRVVVLAVTGFLALALGYQLYVAATNPLGVLHHWGADFSGYMEATHRFLDGGALYDPAQLLYPPPALLVLVPMALLPAVAWWIIPLAVIGYVARRQCRTDWQRVALLAALVFPGGITAIVAGNGSLWIVAAIVAANRWQWPGALILLKPTLAPWALIGIRSRGWWVVVGLLGVVSVILLPLWPQWIALMLGWGASPDWNTGNAGSSSGMAYLTTALSPVFLLAWFATRSGRQHAASGEWNPGSRTSARSRCS